MSRSRNDLGPALVEGVGVFLLAFFGADALFAPESAGLHGLSLVIPALAMAAGFVAYRLVAHAEV